MPFRSTMRADGAPPASTVASVMAFASGTPAPTASSNQRSNWASGSRATSASERPARMYSWRRSAIFIEGFYGRKYNAEGNRRVFPLKVVDTLAVIRHLLDHRSIRRGLPDRSSQQISERSEEKLDGEEESEEGGG